jgi:hypothetical protein
MIDLASEHLISLRDAARRLPAGRRGRPVTLSCLFRWVTEGVTAPGGSRVRLEAVRLGGRWLTTVEALQRFAEAQTPAPRAPAPARRPRSPAARERAAARAERELDRIGI